LVWYPPIHGYQSLEFALGSLDEFTVLLAAPSPLLNGNDIVLLAEVTFESSVEVPVKQ